MQDIKKLSVIYNGRNVGTLAMFRPYQAAFQYSDEWMNLGFSLNPFKLPLKKDVFIAKQEPFFGLHGIFNDSMPDGWGRLLVDRMLLKKNIAPETASILLRLAIVGKSGIGALEYEPSFEESHQLEMEDYDLLAQECRKILNSESSDNLDYIFYLAGSSGGAKPKILTKIDGVDWIVKFPSTYDPLDIGEMEYNYALCAKACGISMPEVRLFPSKNCAGFFGVKRFDRDAGNTKIHMASVSALLDVSHRVPALDYNSLMALTWKLTKNYNDVENMFRLMCFNVFSHNRDDHSRNFSFLCCDGNWHLSPAYDLTYSNSIGGEHATTVNGEGMNPGKEHILAVAQKAGISKTAALEIANTVQETVSDQLSKYL